MITNETLLEWESGFSRREQVHSGPPPYEGYAGSAAGALYLCIQEIRHQRDMLEGQEQVTKALIREKNALLKQIKSIEAHRKAFLEAEKELAIEKKKALDKAVKDKKDARRKEASTVVRNSKSVIPKKDPYRK